MSKEINNEKYWEYKPMNENTTEEESYYRTKSDKCWLVHVVYKSGKSYNHYIAKSICKAGENGTILVPEWAFKHNSVKESAEK